MTKEELEKEIEDYFVQSAGYGRDKVKNFMDIVNKALFQKSERIAELEKENAELKEKLNFSTQYYQGEKAKDNLTKAKELLKRFIETSNPIYFEEDRQKVKAEAEQFLNSEVEK